MSQSDSRIFEYADASTDESNTNTQSASASRNAESLSLSDENTELVTVSNHGGEKYPRWRMMIPKAIRSELDFELDDKLLITPTENGGIRAEPIDE